MHQDKKTVEAFGFVFSSIRTALYRNIFSDEAIRAHEHFYIIVFFTNYDPDKIPEESGYVVDSLTIAIYSVLHTNNYEDAVKMAVNFGYDTDTNAAITGSIACAMYGKKQIPERWLNVLKKKDVQICIGEQFAKYIK